jgi:predicted DNA-binding transcriptional regulator AlpA
MMVSETPASDVFLSARQVRTRYGGVSEQALWRWLRDEKLSFPRPIYINHVRYGRLADLVDWERKRPARRERAAAKDTAHENAAAR